MRARAAIIAGMLRDIRYAVRSLRRSPGFTAVALLTLALGIGATSAIFSAINAVLLRPLPYGSPDRLVLIWNRMVTTNFPHAPVAAPDIVDFRTQATLFEAIAVSDNVPEVALTGDGDPEQIRMAGVSGNFFATLGVRPALGRDFRAEDDPALPPGPPAAGSAPIPIIVSHALWTRRFGGDPAAVGRIVRINDQPREIVGVMPERFRLLMPPTSGMPTNIDAWSPLRIDLSRLPRDFQWLRVFGRLKPGVTLAQAQQEMNGIASWQRSQSLFHRNMDTQIDVFPMHADVVDHVKPTLLALAGTVGFVMLIACANVANLMLARGAARRREMAIRAAIGAGPGRLVRQVLTEGVVLAAAGAGLGLLLAQAGIAALVAAGPADLPRTDAIRIDATVLAVTIALALVSALVFAIAPALSSLAPAGDALNDRHSGRRPTRLGGAIVTAEVALSLVLLAGAGLMMRSFVALQRIDPGFDAGGVLTLNIALPFSRYQQPDARARFFEQAEAAIRALPGVASVGGVFPMPLGGRIWTGPYGREGDPQDAWSRNEANFRTITPGYFSAMATPVLSGRTFSADENRQNAEVVVVDTRLASRLWPGGDAVGKLIGIDLFGQRTFKRVIGVVAHARHETLAADSRETIYFPLRAFPFPPLTLAVRTAGDPGALATPIRAEIHRLDPQLAVYGVQPMTDYVARAMAPTRFAMSLIALFALVAMVLAAVGLYGVLSYLTGQRAHEFGVRLALGAGRAEIFRLVVMRGLVMAGLGIVLGTLAALWLTRIIAKLLIGVRPTDPLTFAAVAAFLLIVVVAACLVPARRAMRVDPLVSLRQD